jgi:hypothetical protein
MTGKRKVGRNDPCPFGSGRKAKRCCGLKRGPDENSAARAFLTEVSRDAAGLLHVSESQFIAIMHEWSGLSAIHPSLRVPLPDHSPAIERLAQAYIEIDADGSREPSMRSSSRPTRQLSERGWYAPSTCCSAKATST